MLDKRLILHQMKALKHKLVRGSSFWLTGFLLLGISTMVMASKGGEDKDKKGYVLKFNGFEVKKTYLTPFSLMQQGASFRGVTTPLQSPACPQNQQSIMTFQKGNTIYIYPLPQKGFVHKLKTPTKSD